MSTWTRCLGVGVWGVWLGMAPAWGQSGLGADVLKLYGGRYALDCANPQSPRVQVQAAAVLVEQGNQRLTAQSLQAAHAYFGQSAPPGFFVALLGQVQGRHEVVFLVQGDARGQYIQIDGDKTVMANLGALGKGQFRSCDPAINQRAQGYLRQEQQASVAAAAPVASGTAAYPSDLIRDARFKPVYRRALGPLASQPWLSRMDGPGVDLRMEQVAGSSYQLVAFCKAHDCGDNNAVLLYDAPQGRVYGLVHMGGRNTVVGSPPGPVMAELNRLWRREWRQGK
ncbi:MAG: Ivy family c-type lysozyme inhibitor [Hydrogenophaga sp.]|uniref:Ivy family c-type lysozyme inhibitor n=2 Tax=Hydrogenophaga sp. TaxID=1904254 RepID=UPI00271CD56F|nr:Ivy family c-type lysozyme inhibitor [Hydrogenophaga sp.]MDO9506137.1 Ivy family c-type lysozyme inhibitor [Hydrogenophaga sp.]MDP2986666.1 Ivy family c-type lysozyme inhibitor [Hydrogenophaga sp.]MDP3203907.1 Ivy family c-type lysozyme inhibitor [Hydrogenophaga sp.]MDP3625069.1 Ivy family c-type lysozyme inhibitor [Hydrogenophaga sp.]